MLIADEEWQPAMQNDTSVGIRKKELFQAFGVLE